MVQIPHDDGWADYEIDRQRDFYWERLWDLTRTLLPCPFCGSLAEVLEHEEVACTNCGASIKSAEIKTPEQAAEIWNRRVPYEADGYFFLPKPKEKIVTVTDTLSTWDGTKVKMDCYYAINEMAIAGWARELDEHITQRICEVFSKDKSCYSEREDCWECSECGFHDAYVKPEWYSYCPRCGAKVVER
jgi:predicted Zn-ribbon and HTH transcriptional regulator